MISDDEAAELKREISAGGWAALETRKATQLAEWSRAKALERRQSEALIVAECLQGPKGEAFLGWLERLTVKCPPGPEADPKSVDEFTLAAARKQGRDQVYWLIVQALQEAESGRRAQPKESKDAS